MNMFEEAGALQGTIRLCGVTQGELARRLHVSQSYIANKLRLLQLSPALREEIEKHGLSERHARALLHLETDSERHIALSHIIKEGLTVRGTEELVDRLYKTGRPDGGLTAIEGFEESLRRALCRLGSGGYVIRQKRSETEDVLQIYIEIAK